MAVLTYGDFLFRMVFICIAIAGITIWLGRTSEYYHTEKALHFGVMIIGLTLVAWNITWMVQLFLMAQGIDTTGFSIIYGIFHIIMEAILLSLAVHIMYDFRNARSLRTYYLVVLVGLLVLLLGYLLVNLFGIVRQTSGGKVVLLGSITLTFISLCGLFGIIPVNRRHGQLFKNSTLKMQIVDPEQRQSIESKTAGPLSDDIISAIVNGETVIRQDDDSVIHGSRVGSRYIIWQEDTSELNGLYRQTSELIDRLILTNRILSEREKQDKKNEVRRITARISKELGVRLHDKLDALSELSEALRKSNDPERIVPELTLLLCYIKRQVNLFFLSKEKATIEYDEMSVYIDELCSIAQYANTRVMYLSLVSGEFRIDDAATAYELDYEFLRFFIKNGYDHVLVRLEKVDGTDCLKIISSKRIDVDELSDEIRQCMKNLNISTDYEYADDLPVFVMKLIDWEEADE